MKELEPMPTFEQMLTALLLFEADYARKPAEAAGYAAAICVRYAMARLSTVRYAC
jgi:hypothetical protein